MKRIPATGAVVHGLLLALALGAAYQDWTREKTEVQTGVSVWQLDSDSIRAIDLQTRRTKVHAELRSDDTGTEGREAYVWFRIERTPLATPGMDASPEEAEAEPFIEIKEFRGADRSLGRIEELAELQADRALGILDVATLEGLGLADPKGQLSIETAQGKVSLQVGEKAVGDRLRYVRTPEDGRVFVVQDHLVSDLELADSRLLNRELHGFTPDDVQHAEVTVGEETRAYDRNEDGTRKYWAPSESPQEEDEQVTTWMSRLTRLRVERYLAEGEDPFDDAGFGVERPEISVLPERLLRIDLRTRAGGTGFLTVTRHGTDDDSAIYTARTEHTKSEVVINRFLTQEAIQDLDDLFPGATPAEDVEPEDEVVGAETEAAEAEEMPAAEDTDATSEVPEETEAPRESEAPEVPEEPEAPLEATTDAPPTTP